MVDDLSRRAMLAAPALLVATVGTTACAQPAPPPRQGASKLLVAYVTRSGNTRVIAGTIHRALQTDLFEILPSQPYPADYEEHVEQARQERDRGFEPTLAAPQPDMAGYETIYLGFPIWGETTPPTIRSFLKAHDFRGKTIRPFITHGGFGIGNSMSVITSHARGAQIEQPFVLEADQERRTLNQVKGWLAEAGQG